MPSKTDQGGGIIRVAHDARNPYTVINRTFTEDPALSWEAAGLLAYLLCKPDTWQVRVPALMRMRDAKRDKIQRMLKELEAAHYLVRAREHDPATGRWAWVSTVYETPQPGLPVMVNPVTVEPSTVNRAIKEVVTAPSSNGNEYREEAVPLSNETDALPPHLAAARARIVAPPAATVQAGTAPSRATGPEERRR